MRKFRAGGHAELVGHMSRPLDGPGLSGEPATRSAMQGTVTLVDWLLRAARVLGEVHPLALLALAESFLAGRGSVIP